MATWGTLPSPNAGHANLLKPSLRLLFKTHKTGVEKALQTRLFPC
jgi:hypothetical protein